MIGLSRRVRVFAYTRPVDMRKLYDGLYALVVAELQADPLSGDLFLFTNRRRTRAKVLLWDGTGLCLYQKRIERGRFASLWRRDEEESFEMTLSELALFPEASEILDRIGQLYAIEAEAKRASPEEWLATLAALRAKQSKPILDEIRTWLMTQRALPRSALGKAIAYTSGLWPGLVRFLGDPKIPLDTNGVERALRGVAVGRKNHYGSRSERGTRVAALFYSLIESAKPCGVEPRGYLGEAARRAIRNPGTVTLPRDLK